jgi:prolyl oligopeptidase
LEGASLFFDPNTLSKDGSAMVGDSAWSKDWKNLAILVQNSGSDWGTIKIMDSASRKFLKDELDWCKHSFISWTKDNKGFFYARYDAPKHADVSQAGKETDKLQNQKVFYHNIGTEQKDDVLIYQNKEQPLWLFGAGVTDDGDYLILQTMKGTEKVNLFSYAKIKEGITKNTTLKVVPLIDEWVGSFDNIYNNGTKFYFQTNHKAPNNKVIMIDLTKPK